MAGHRSWNASAARITERPGARQRIDAYKREVVLATELAAVREGLGVTQAQLAERLQMKQPNISRMEHVDDLHLSTLVQYVKALGGKLVLEMAFPDTTYELDAEAITTPSTVPA
jgi:ribosome-binding protein aMBF1 (putative translation factor)